MTLVFASSNSNKISEIRSILPQNIIILGLNDIGCFEEIPETATTIEGNAIIKANYVSDKYGYNCFSDDTGLEVEVLNGAPGVYSARYAGEQKDSDDNMTLLLEQLKPFSNKKASFKTVIALNLDGKQYLFTGEVKGEIAKEKSGLKGFGYDPIFIPDGFSITFAEFSNEEKNKISHRAIATQKLLHFIENSIK